MIIIIAESTGVAQVEEPMASTDAEDNPHKASTAEPNTVKSVPTVIISEAVTIHSRRCRHNFDIEGTYYWPGPCAK